MKEQTVAKLILENIGGKENKMCIRDSLWDDRGGCFIQGACFHTVDHTVFIKQNETEVVAVSFHKGFLIMNIKIEITGFNHTVNTQQANQLITFINTLNQHLFILKSL